MFILENLKNIKNTVKITYNPSGHRYLLFMFGCIFKKMSSLTYLYMCACICYICDYMLLNQISMLAYSFHGAYSHNRILCNIPHNIAMKM